MTTLHQDRYRIMLQSSPDASGQKPKRLAFSVAGVRFKAWQPPEALHPVFASQCTLAFRHL